MEPCYEAKVFSIFKLFDVNGDRVLSREEMAVYAVSVNPVAKISDEEINAYLNEIFYTYGEIVDGKEGLTYAGLLFSYYDGFGDANRDFDTFAYDLKLIDLDPIENDISREAEIEQATKREQATEKHAKCSIECQGEIIEGMLESGDAVDKVTAEPVENSINIVATYDFEVQVNGVDVDICLRECNFQIGIGDSTIRGPKPFSDAVHIHKKICCLNDAYKVFDNMPEKNTFTWNSSNGLGSSYELLWDPGGWLKYNEPDLSNFEQADSISLQEDNMVEIRKNRREESLMKKRREGLPANQQFPLSAQSASTNEKKLENLPGMIAGVWSNDNSLQLEATTQFRKLLSIERIPPIEEVIQSGVVPRFVEFLMREDYPQLQFEAAWVLTNIASGTSEHTKVVIDHGAVPIFVKLLGSPIDDVREQAVWALGNVAGDSPKCRDLVLGHGVLVPLLSQLNEHAKLSMLRNATWTLSNFCRGKPQPSFDQTKPALPVLQHLIHSNDEEVLTDACWALSYLSDGTNDKIQAVIESGVCPRLVELLTHPSPSVLIPALRTVGNIITGDDMQTQFIINNQALPCLLNLLTNNHKKSIKKEACWTISNITAGNKEQIQSVVEANIIGPLVHLLQNAEFDIKKEAAWAISNATSGGTVITIGVFDNCHLQIGDNVGGVRNSRIRKVKNCLYTLKIESVCTCSYLLLVLLSYGVKKMGEIHLTVRFINSLLLKMIHTPSKPLLLNIHRIYPLTTAQLDDNSSFIEDGQLDRDVVWKALFCACSIHRDITMGKNARENNLEPKHLGSYFFLSNIYAAVWKMEDVGVRMILKNRDAENDLHEKVGDSRPTEKRLAIYGKSVAAYHEEAQQRKPKLQRWLIEFGEVDSKAVVILSVSIAYLGSVLFKWPLFGTPDCRGSGYRVLGLMVVASPCALSVAPLAYATAIRACAKKGILLKGGHVFDYLASCYTVAFDKTGTLTTGEFMCKAIEPIHGHLGGNKSENDTCCIPNCKKEALTVAAAMERGTTHPIGRAVIDHSLGKDLPAVYVESFENLPGRGLYMEDVSSLSHAKWDVMFCCRITKLPKGVG